MTETDQLDDEDIWDDPMAGNIFQAIFDDNGEIDTESQEGLALIAKARAELLVLGYDPKTVDAFLQESLDNCDDGEEE